MKRNINQIYMRMTSTYTWHRRRHTTHTEHEHLFSNLYKFYVQMTSTHAIPTPKRKITWNLKFTWNLHEIYVMNKDASIWGIRASINRSCFWFEHSNVDGLGDTMGACVNGAFRWTSDWHLQNAAWRCVSKDPIPGIWSVSMAKGHDAKLGSENDNIDRALRQGHLRNKMVQENDRYEHV